MKTSVPKFILKSQKERCLNEGKRISERIINLAAQFLGYKVEYLGCIPEDSLVQASVIRQKPFIIVNPTSKPSISLKHIVEKIKKTENIDMFIIYRVGE